MINGMSATTDLSGVGTSPKVEWQAPSLGVAPLYRIYLFEVAPALTFPKFAGSIATAGTSFVFPPGMLTAGKWYTLRIQAEDGLSDTAPYRSAYVPKATALTSPFTP